MPQRGFSTAVALHTHSYHSREDLDALNHIMELPILRKLNGIFKRSFREKAKEELDYANLHYSPPISPEEVYDLELNSARVHGFDRLLLAISDHDKIVASQELMEKRPDLQDYTSISEELSFKYENQVFHLGVVGIPVRSADAVHKRLQDMAARNELDEMFELLRENRCLVIFNHPLYALKKVGNHEQLVTALLRRYGWAIDALEYNGMRCLDENNAVLELARVWRKPIIGGGDRHSPLPSTVLSAGREAENFPDFFEEVRKGRAVAVCLPNYFKPHGWKMFVRILYYVEAYRRIVFYRDIPITAFPIDERIIPDYFADVARFLLRLFNGLRLVG